MKRKTATTALTSSGDCQMHGEPRLGLGEKQTPRQRNDSLMHTEENRWSARSVQLDVPCRDGRQSDEAR